MSKGNRKPLPPIETLGEAREKFARLAKRYGTKLAETPTTTPQANP